LDDLYEKIDNSINYIDFSEENKKNLFKIAISEEAMKPAQDLFEESQNIF
jgi:hypothetical protein